jgi:putative ABC transport system substrate-binding protein
MKNNITALTLCTMLTALFALCFPAEAEQAKALARVGYLGIDRSPPELRQEEVFRHGLREHGWIEGQKIVIERRYWENRVEQLPALAEDLVRLKMDIIVTSTGTAALAAKKATTTIPIVMAASANAVTQGLVDSLARPGGNVTGLTNIAPEVAGKRLELLKEAFPRVSRVAVLRCPATAPTSTSNLQWSETQTAAKVLRVQLQPLEVSGPKEVEGALRAATREGANGLYVSDCTRIPTSKTTELAAKSQLPAIYPNSRFVDDGGLMSYAMSILDQFRRAATYVDKILKGAKPLISQCSNRRNSSW